jgi:hypothetical protein
VALVPDAKNLVALHMECHLQVTYTKKTALKARFTEMGLIQQINKLVQLNNKLKENPQQKVKSLSL